MCVSYCVTSIQGRRHQECFTVVGYQKCLFLGLPFLSPCQWLEPWEEALRYPPDDACLECCQKTCRCLENLGTVHTLVHSPPDVALDVTHGPTQIHIHMQQSQPTRSSTYTYYTRGEKSPHTRLFTHTLTPHSPVCLHTCLLSLLFPTLTCLPMGSGLVTVVEKKPSHSSLP